jgi:hypothetical protein
MVRPRAINFLASPITRFDPHRILPMEDWVYVPTMPITMNDLNDLTQMETAES